MNVSVYRKNEEYEQGAYTWILALGGAEAGFWVQGQSGLHIQFQASLAYIERPC